MMYLSKITFKMSIFYIYNCYIFKTFFYFKKLEFECSERVLCAAPTRVRPCVCVEHHVFFTLLLLLLLFLRYVLLICRNFFFVIIMWSIHQLINFCRWSSPLLDFLSQQYFLIRKGAYCLRLFNNVCIRFDF